MRKLNTYISLALCVVFLVHLVMGSFMVLGIGHNGGKYLALAGLILLAIHITCSVISTGRTCRRLGVRHLLLYGRQNALFWLRRCTGLLILLFLLGHIGLFGTVMDGQYVLFEFTWQKLVLQLLFMTALSIHILTNIRPLFVSLGWYHIAPRSQDVYIIVGVLYLFSVLAMAIYYVGWQVL